MNLSKAAEKVLSRFCADGYYVYMRPMSSAWFKGEEPHRVYWNVDVEYRNAKWMHWKAKGLDLDAVLIKLGEIVPRREKLQPGFVPAGKQGRSEMVGVNNSIPVDLDEVEIEIRSASAQARQESAEKKYKKSKKGKKK